MIVFAQIIYNVKQNRSTMKKTIKLAILTTLTLSAFCGIVLPNRTYAATTTFDQNIDSIPFTRNVTGVSNPVTNTFTYTITADSDNPDVATNGPAGSTTVVFDATAPVSNTATESGVIDFSGVTFNRTGDYYFTITETSSTNSSLYPVDSATYTAQVSVRYAVVGGVTDPNTFVVTLAQNMQKTGGDKEAAVWSSASPRTYFELSAKTTGNSADVNHCFTYTLNIPAVNGISAGDSFAIGGATCDGNPATVTAGQDTAIKLKSDDVVTVGLLNNSLGQLPIGSGYTITLVDAEGYEVAINGTDTTAGTAQTVSGLVAQDDADFNDNNSEFELTKNIAVLTGVFSNTLVYIAIFGVGALGLIYFSRKNSSRK